jgi:hypothetical protein
MTPHRPLPGPRKPYDGPGQGMGIVDAEGAEWLAELAAEAEAEKVVDPCGCDNSGRMCVAHYEEAWRVLEPDSFLVRFTPGPKCRADHRAALAAVLKSISPQVFTTEVVEDA